MVFCYLLSILFLTILISMVRNTYTFSDDCFNIEYNWRNEPIKTLIPNVEPNERYKFPLYAWIIVILLTLIPYFGWVVPVGAMILLIYAYNDKDVNMTYKSGKFISFLTKKI